MGLEFSELLFAIEERYGIFLIDDDWAKIQTVGDLVEVCHDRVRGVSTNWCVYLPAFLDLRRTVRAAADDSKLSVYPHAKITDVLTPDQRRALWRRLPNLDATDSVSLRRPLLLRIALYLMWFSAGAALLFAELGGWTLYMAALLAIGLVLNLVTRPFKSVPPARLRTFGDVSRRMPLTNINAKKAICADSAALFDDLRPMIAEIVDMREEEISLKSHLVKDLGMG